MSGSDPTGVIGRGIPEHDPFPKENHLPSLLFWVPVLCFHGVLSQIMEIRPFQKWPNTSWDFGETQKKTPCQTRKAGEEVTISYGEQSQDMTWHFICEAWGRFLLGAMGWGGLR